MRSSIPVTLGLCFAVTLSVFAQSSVAPTAMTLVPGQAATFTLTPADSATPSSTAPGVATVADNVVRAVAPGTATIELKDSAGAVAATIAVTVQPFSKIELVCDRCGRDFVPEERRTIANVAAFGPNNEVIDAALISPAFTIEPKDTNVITRNGTQFTATTRRITGKEETQLEVKVGNLVVASIPVVVREAIRAIEAPPTIDLQEDESFPANGIVLRGEQNSAFTPKTERALTLANDNPFVHLMDDGRLRALRLPADARLARAVMITLVSDEGRGAAAVRQNVTVNITPAASLVRFNPADVTITPGRVATIQALLYSRTGERLPNVFATWDFEDPDDEQFFVLSESKDTVTLHWKSTNDPRPDFVKLVASVRREGQSAAEEIKGTVVVKLVPFPTRFAPLDVRLTLMDEQTAADLFGAVTAREYHIARLRMYNNLRSEDASVIGASILAFSESIEVAVRYQKRKAERRSRWSRERDRDRGWEALKQEELESLYLLGAEPVPLRLYSRGVSTLSRMRGTGAEPDQDDDGGEDEDEAEVPQPRSPACRGSLIYRPYSFDMMANSVDRRDERSTRSRVFRGLSAVATLGTTLTAVGVGARSDLPVILEKYGNLFIPGMEKIWPSLLETQRQNVINQTMKPIEEIPYGSDLARVIFFPKGPFRGVLEDQEVRIATICPFYFQIEVAILEKSGRIPVSTNVNPDPQN
jgi:hypothetical protein